MAQTVRITITPDLEHALQILHRSTMGTLNTTELIKMAIGKEAERKEPLLSENDKNWKSSGDIDLKECDRLSAIQFYEWAREDKTLGVDNIAHPENLKPFVPKPYVRTR